MGIGRMTGTVRHKEKVHRAADIKVDVNITTTNMNIVVINLQNTAAVPIVPTTEPLRKRYLRRDKIS